jgi:hypothetical protein
MNPLQVCTELQILRSPGGIIFTYYAAMLLKIGIPSAPKPIGTIPTEKSGQAKAQRMREVNFAHA